MKEPHKVKKVISEVLGVDFEDISSDDSLILDLHLKPTDITELIEKLSEEGVDMTKVDFSQIDTVSELEEILEEGSAQI